MRKIALLTSDRVTCQVNDGGYVYVCVSILQLYAWDGCGTATGYAKHMHRYHSNGKSRHYYWLSVSYFYYLHSLPSAEEDYELIGPPEYVWLNTCISPYQCAPFSCTYNTYNRRRKEILNCYIFLLFVVCYLTSSRGKSWRLWVIHVMTSECLSRL